MLTPVAEHKPVAKVKRFLCLYLAAAMALTQALPYGLAQNAPVTDKGQLESLQPQTAQTEQEPAKPDDQPAANQPKSSLDFLAAGDKALSAQNSDSDGAGAVKASWTWEVEQEGNNHLSSSIVGNDGSVDVSLDQNGNITAIQIISGEKDSEGNRIEEKYTVTFEDPSQRGQSGDVVVTRELAGNTIAETLHGNLSSENNQFLLLFNNVKGPAYLFPEAAKDAPESSSQAAGRILEVLDNIQSRMIEDRIRVPEVPREAPRELVLGGGDLYASIKVKFTGYGDVTVTSYEDGRVTGYTSYLDANGVLQMTSDFVVILSDDGVPRWFYIQEYDAQGEIGRFLTVNCTQARWDGAANDFVGEVVTSVYRPDDTLDYRTVARMNEAGIPASIKQTFYSEEGDVLGFAESDCSSLAWDQGQPSNGVLGIAYFRDASKKELLARIDAAYQDGFIVKMERTDFDQNGGVIGVYPVVKFALIQQYVQPLIDFMNVFSLKNESVKIGPSTELELKIRSQVVEDVSKLTGLSQSEVKKLIDSIVVDLKTMKVSIKFKAGSMNSSRLVGPIDEDALPDLMDYQFEKSEDGATRIKSAQMIWRPAQYISGGLTAALTYGKDGAVQQIQWTKSVFCQKDMICPLGMAFLYTDSYSYGGSNIIIHRGLTSAAQLVMTLVMFQDQKFYIAKLAEYGPEDSLVSSTEFQYTGYYIVEPRNDENGNWVPGVQGYLVNNIFRKDASGRALSAISVNMFEHKAVVSIADSGEQTDVSFTSLNDLLSQVRNLEAQAARIAKIIKLLKSLHRVVQYQGYDSGKGHFLLKTVAPGEVVFSVTVDPCQGRPGCMAPVSFRQVRVIIEAVDVSVDYFRMPVVDLVNSESVVKLQMGAGGLVFGISLPRDPSVTLAGVEETPEAVVRARQAFDKAAKVIGEINAGPYVTLKDAKLLREVQLDLKAAVENLSDEDRAEFIKKFNEYLAKEDRIVSSKPMLVELSDGRQVVVRNSTDVMAQIIRRFRMLVPNGEVDLGRLAGIAPEDLKKLESAQEYFNGRLIGSTFELPSFDLFSPLGYLELVDRLVRKYPVTVTEGPETVLNVEGFLRHVDGTQQVYDAAMAAIEKVYASHPFKYTEDPMTLEGIKKAIEDLGVLNQLLAEAANQVIAGFQGEEVFRALVSEQIAGVLNRYDSKYIQFWQQLNQAFYNRGLTLVINGVKVSVSRADLNEFANRLPSDTFDLYRYPGVKAQVDPSFLGALIRQNAYNQLAQIRLGKQPLPGAPEEWPSDPRLAHLLMAYPAKFQVLEVMLKTWAKEVILADGTVNFDKLRFRMLISYELELELGKAEEYLKNQTARMNEIGNKKTFTPEDYASMKALLEETKKELQKRFNPLLKDVIYDTFNEVTVRVQDRFKMLADAFNGILAKVSVAVQLADGTVLVVKPSDIRQRVLEPILNAMSIRGSNGAFTTDAYLRMNGVDASMVEGLLDLNAMSQLTAFDFNVWTSSYKTPYLADTEILFRLIPRIVGHFGTADTAALTKKLTENVEMPVPVGESLEAVIAQTIEKLGVNALAGLDAIKIETIEDYLKVREVVRSYVRDLTERLMKLTKYLSSTEISQIESGVNYWSGKYPNNLWAVLQKFVSKVDAIDSLTVNGIRVPVAQIRAIENFPVQFQYDTELFPGIVANDFAGAETTAQRAVYSSISLGRSLYGTGGDNGYLTAFGRTQVAVGIVKRLLETVPPPAGIFFDKGGVKEVDPEIFRQYIKGVLAMKEAVYAEARQRTAELIAEFKALEKGAYTIEEINALHGKLLALRQGLIDFLSAKAQKHERRDVIATEDAVSLIYQEAFKYFVGMVGRAKLVINIRGVSVTVPAKEITTALIDYLKKNVTEKVSASEFAKLYGIDVEMVRRVHKLENYLGEQIVDLPRNAEYVQIVSQISELGYMQLAVMLVEKYGGQVVKNGAVDTALLIDLVTNKDVAVGYFKKAADGVYGEAVAAIRAFDGKPMTLKDIESFAGILSDLRVRLVSMGNDFLSGNADDALQKDLEVYITSLYEKLRQLASYENRVFLYEVEGRKIEVKLTKEMMGKFFKTIMEYLFTHPVQDSGSGYEKYRDELVYEVGKDDRGGGIVPFVRTDAFPRMGIWMPVQPKGDYNPAYHPTELAMAVLFCRLAAKYGEFAVKPDATGALQFDLESFLKELLLTDQSRLDRRLDRILEENLPRLQKYLEGLKDSNGAIPVASLEGINAKFVDVRNMILALNDRTGKAQSVWDAFMKLYEGTLLGEKSLLSFEFNGRKVTFEAGVLDKILMDLYYNGKLDPAVTKKFADLISKGETQWAYNSFRWLQMWFEPIYFDYGRNIVQVFDSLSPEEGDAAHTVDRLITFGALATIPGINGTDLSGLEAAETAGRLKLTPVDPETLMGLLDMRSLAPGSGVSAGGLMAQSYSYAKAETVGMSDKYAVDEDYIYWRRPIGWELGNTSQRFRDFEFLPELIKAIAAVVGEDSIFANGRVNSEQFRAYLQNFPTEMSPAQRVALMIQADLIASFGFVKDSLQDFIKQGLVKIEVDLENLTATVTLDPSVSFENVNGAAYLADLLDVGRKLPAEIRYKFGLGPQLGMPCTVSADGTSVCPPTIYQLESAGYELGNSFVEVSYLGVQDGIRTPYRDGRIQSVKVYDGNPYLRCITAPCPTGKLVREVSFDYYKEGASSVVAVAHVGYPQIGLGFSRDVFVSRMADGALHISTINDLQDNNVIATSSFYYETLIPDCAVPEDGVAHCAGPFVDLTHIIRTDPQGKTLSEITDIDNSGSDFLYLHTANVRVEGASANVPFNTWRELLDQVRKLEGKQDFIREAIAKYLKINSKDILQLDLEDVEDFVTCMGPGCPTWSKYVSVLALVNGEKKHFAGQVTGGAWGITVFDEAAVKAMDLNGDGMIDENDLRLLQFGLGLPDFDGNGKVDEADFRLFVLAMNLPDLDGNGTADGADFQLLVMAMGLPDLDGNGTADENDFQLFVMALGLPDLNGDGVRNDLDVQALQFALSLPDFNKDGVADRLDADWLRSLLVEYRSSKGVIVIENIKYSIEKNAYGIVRFIDDKGRIFVADKEGLISLNEKLYVVKQDAVSGDYIVKPYQMEVPVFLVEINHDGKFDLQDVLAYENGLRVREIGDVNRDGLVNALDADMYLRGLQVQQQGDINGDGITDQKDADLYRSGLQVRRQGDVNGDGITDQKDLELYGLGLRVRKEGDVNGDGVTNRLDANAYQQGLEVLAQADFNHDGVTNRIDLNLLESYLMKDRLSSLFLLETDPLIDGRALRAISEAARVAMDQLRKVDLKLQPAPENCPAYGCNPDWSGDLQVTVKQGDNPERYFEGEISRMLEVTVVGNPKDRYRVSLIEVGPPAQRVLKAHILNDLVKSFGFDKAKLETLIKQGAIKFEIDLERLTVRVLFDETVSPEDLLSGVAYLADPLGLKRLPSTMEYSFGEGPQMGMPCTVSPDGTAVCPPPVYFIQSASFRIREAGRLLLYELSYMPEGDILRQSGDDRLHFVTISELNTCDPSQGACGDWYSRTLKTIGYSYGYANPEGPQPVMTAHVTDWPVESPGTRTQDVFFKDFGDGKLHIEKIQDHLDGKLVSVSQFVYVIAMPNCAVDKDGNVSPGCNQVYVALEGIDRQDAEGNLLSKIRDFGQGGLQGIVDPNNPLYGANVYVTRDVNQIYRVNFRSWDALLKQVRWLEKENSWPLSKPILLAIAEYLGVSIEDLTDVQYVKYFDTADRCTDPNNCFVCNGPGCQVQQGALYVSAMFNGVKKHFAGTIEIDPVRYPPVISLSEIDPGQMTLINWVNNPDFNFDFDQDGKLTVEDYSLFKSFDGELGDRQDLLVFLTPEAKKKLDLNGDGMVSPDDVLLFGDWLQNLPRLRQFAEAIQKANGGGDLNGDAKVDEKDIAFAKDGYTAAFEVLSLLPREVLDALDYNKDKKVTQADADKLIADIQAIIDRQQYHSRVVEVLKNLFQVVKYTGGEKQPDQYFMEAVTSGNVTLTVLFDPCPPNPGGMRCMAVAMKYQVTLNIRKVDHPVDYFAMPVVDLTREGEVTLEMGTNGLPFALSLPADRFHSLVGAEEYPVRDDFFMEQLRRDILARVSGELALADQEIGAIRPELDALIVQIQGQIDAIRNDIEGSKNNLFGLVNQVAALMNQPWVDPELGAVLRDFHGRALSFLDPSNPGGADILAQRFFEWMIGDGTAGLQQRLESLQMYQNDLFNYQGLVLGAGSVEELRRLENQFPQRHGFGLRVPPPEDPRPILAMLIDEGQRVVAQNPGFDPVRAVTAAIDAKLGDLFGEGNLHFAAVVPLRQPMEDGTWSISGEILDAENKPVVKEYWFGCRILERGEVQFIDDFFAPLLVPSEKTDSLVKFLKSVSDAAVDLQFAIVQNPNAAGIGGEVVDEDLYRFLAVREGRITLSYELSKGGGFVDDIIRGVVVQGSAPQNSKVQITFIVLKAGEPKPAYLEPGAVYLEVGQTYGMTFNRGGANVEVPRQDYNWLHDSPQILVKVAFGDGILQIVSQRDQDGVKQVKATLSAPGGDSLLNLTVGSYDDTDPAAIVVKTLTGEKVTFYPKTVTYQSVKNIESDIYPGIPLTQTQVFKLVKDADGKSKFEMTSNILRNALTGALVQSAVRRQTPSGLVEFFKAQMPGEMGYTISLARMFNKVTNSWNPYSGAIVRRNNARATVINASFSVEPSGVARAAEADVRYSGATQHVKMTFGLSLAFDECPKEWGLLCA